MTTVAALTSGRNRPSSRFRVRQHIDLLSRVGVHVREFVPAVDAYARLPCWSEESRHGCALPLLLPWLVLKLATRLPGLVGCRRYDVTWLQRGFLPGLSSLEGLIKRPIVFDVDDAVWLQRPRGEHATRWIAQRSAVVMVGNVYLADWFSCHNKDVRIVPTAVDTQRFRPRADDDDRPFTIGWTGSASNYEHVSQVITSLRRFLSEHRDSRLLLMAERPPDFLSADDGTAVRFWRWSHGDEVRAVQAMDVGIMPLPDNPWTRGKCSFKMLQYMACGVPVIVSPVGMNNQVMALGDVGLQADSKDDWYDALRFLYLNREKGRTMGRRGRRVIEENFAARKLCAEIGEIFHEVS